MTRRTLAAFFAILAAAATAAELPPLLPPATAPKGYARVRVPLGHGDDGRVLQAVVQIPKGGKRGGFADATAAIASGTGYGVVTTNKLKAWGYTAPAGKPFTLPELVLTGRQLAPAPAADKAVVRARVAGLKFQVVEGAPDGKDTIFGADLLVNFPDVAKTPAAELRLFFRPRAFEFNAPAAQVKPADPPKHPPELAPEPRPVPNAPVDPPPDPTAVPFALPITYTPFGPAFGGLAVNGVDTAKGMNGQAGPLVGVMSSAHYTQPGLVLTRGLAYAVGLDEDASKPGKSGTAADRKAEYVPSKVKEVRLLVRAGPGLAAVKELVLTDVPVMIDKGTSEPLAFVGPHFLTTHFQDAVFAGTAAGGLLHARVKPARLRDPPPKAP